MNLLCYRQQYKSDHILLSQTKWQKNLSAARKKDVEFGWRSGIIQEQEQYRQVFQLQSPGKVSNYTPVQYVALLSVVSWFLKSG